MIRPREEGGHYESRMRKGGFVQPSGNVEARPAYLETIWKIILISIINASGPENYERHMTT